jgi:hypothetical protein
MIISKKSLTIASAALLLSTSFAFAQAAVGAAMETGAGTTSKTTTGSSMTGRSASEMGSKPTGANNPTFTGSKKSSGAAAAGAMTPAAGGAQ